MLKQYLFLSLLFLSLVFACKEREPAPGLEAQVANKDWQTEGMYVAGVKIEAAPYIKIRFSKSLVNGIQLNGQNLGPLALWSVATTPQNTISISYPSYADGGATIQSQTLRITKSTDTELWLAPIDGQEVSLLGVINLPTNGEFRFTLNPNSVSNVTSAELTGRTWTGTGTNAGYYTTGTTPIKQGNANVTLKFKTFYGMNYVEMSGTPSPITWSLNPLKTKLILSYPKINQTSGGVIAFDIRELTNTSLILGATNTVNIGGIITFPIGQELRMIPAN
jgi:hypothetical protein